MQTILLYFILFENVRTRKSLKYVQVYTNGFFFKFDDQLTMLYIIVSNSLKKVCKITYNKYVFCVKNVIYKIQVKNNKMRLTTKRNRETKLRKVASEIHCFRFVY